MLTREEIAERLMQAHSNTTSRFIADIRIDRSWLRQADVVLAMLAEARAEARREALEEAALLFEPTNTWNLHFCKNHSAQVIRALAAPAPEEK